MARPSIELSGHETILLAEDEDSLRGLVSTLLKRRGYKVIQASSGVEALKWRQSNTEKIDLLLTDLIMPGGMDGLELGAQL